MPSDIPKKKRNDGLQSLERGLRVILAFDSENPSMTIGTASDRTNLDRATARRALLTLLEMGFVKQEGRLFRLTPKVLRLAAPYFSSTQFIDLAQSLMRDFVEKFGISASVCVLDETEIVYVARVEARRLIRLDVGIGSRLPAHLTALGRVLLAASSNEQVEKILGSLSSQKAVASSPRTTTSLKKELHSVKKQGYACVDSELEGGLLAVAVPITNSSGEVIASIGCSAHVGQVSAEDLLSDPLVELREMAKTISECAQSGPSLPFATTH